MTLAYLVLYFHNNYVFKLFDPIKTNIFMVSALRHQIITVGNTFQYMLKLICIQIVKSTLLSIYKVQNNPNFKYKFKYIKYIKIHSQV